MKKNIFTILLALALVLSCVFVVAPDAHAAEAHSHCYCVNAEHVPETHVCEENVTWVDLSDAPNTITESGHYYLTKNLAKGVIVSSAIEVTICLNGYNLYAGCPLTISSGGVVNICNCQSEGCVYSTNRTKEAAVLISSSSTAIGTLNLYSGNISGSANSGAKIRAVAVKGGVFNMYGGQLVNGASDGTNTKDTKVGLGGNISVYNNAGNIAKFNLYGGTVTGGKANTSGGNVYVEGGIFTMYGGTVTGGKVTGAPTTDAPLTGAGGNIYVCSTGSVAKFDMYGGTVQNGEAALGGNIAGNGQNIIDNANGKRVDLKINGGTIENGTATDNGGNIYLHNTTNGVKTDMTNGTISGGTAVNGGNIYAKGNNPLTITAGTISGGIASENGGNLYIERVVTVKGGVIENGSAVNGGNLYVCGGLTFNGGEIKNGTAANNGGSIYALAAIDLTGASVSGGKSTSNGGNIYSNQAVTIGENTVISGGTADNNGGNIYLTGDTAHLIMTAGTVTEGTAGNTGGNINALNSSNVKIEGGQITNGAAASHGGNLYVTNQLSNNKIVTDRKLVITGATISGGSAGTEQILGEDGTVIQESKPGNGGNIWVKAGQVSISGATITDGSATSNGGNIYANQDKLRADDPETPANEGGILTITGATITGGNALLSGGNLNVILIGDVQMTDCVVSGGSAESNSAKVHGGNLYLGSNGNVTVSGGTYTSYWGNRNEANNNNYNKAKRVSGNGGNICINSGAVTIENATILGGDSDTAGGAIYNGGTLTLKNVTAKSSGSASGKTLYIAKGASATVEDCELVNWGTNGSAIVTNGNLILKGNISMPKEWSTSEIKNGTAAPTTDITVDCSEAAAVIDLTELTSVDSGLAEAENYYFDGKLLVNKIGAKDAEGKAHTEEGLIATGATAETFALLEAKNVAYKLNLVENQVYLVSKAIQGLAGNDIVIGYDSLADIAEGDGATWYILNDHLASQTINKSIMLDLRGYDLAAEIAEGVSVAVIDSANDKYDASACGNLTVTGAGTVETLVHTTVNKGGAVKHYVLLKDANGVYSAHRYVAAVLTMSLKPGADALGFKTTYSADEVARAAITSYGIRVWVNEGHKVVNAKNEAFAKPASTLTLRVQNILANNGGQTDIYGDAFIAFNVDGQQIIASASSEKASVKRFVETMNAGMADGSATYTDAQIQAVQQLLTKFESQVEKWVTDYIMAWPEQPEVPETSEPAENL